MVATLPSPVAATTPARAAAVGHAWSREGRATDGLVAVIPLPRQVGAIPDVASATAPVLAPTQVAGTRPAGSNVAPVRGPIAPVSPAPLVLPFGLGAVLMRRLDEGGDAVRAAVLAMAALPPATRRGLNVRLAPRLGLIGGLGRTPRTAGANVLGSPLQATPAATVTSHASCTGRP